ncbi:MAG: DUF3299 domain-containing protein [Pirellula sp.]|jgi:hypothetical protein|nr:DUF3299 domain-containing protein [Pirellula sp.]
MRADEFDVRSGQVNHPIFAANALWLVFFVLLVGSGVVAGRSFAVPPESDKSSDADKIADEEKQKPGNRDRAEASSSEDKAQVDRQTDSASGNRGKSNVPVDPNEVAKERKAREAAKKRGEITFDDLKFEIEKGAPFKSEMLTNDNKDLHKKTWQIRGFILPTTLFSKSNIREFVLVRDNQECCFGPGAALYDCIMITMAPGKSINFSTRVVAVKGVLEIDTESFLYPDSEEHYAIYKMTAEEVK